MIKRGLIFTGFAAVVGAGAYYAYQNRLFAKPEVYIVTDGSYFAKPEDAVEVAKLFDGVVATDAQINDAWKAGAEWCSTGWFQSGSPGVVSSAGYPMQHLDPGGGCGVKSPLNLFISPDGLANVTIYGVKPRKSAKPKNFNGKNLYPLPFNGSEWGAPSNSIY